jgi:catechol 2,3-dioxygenase-like lactoylglutathione lyase family enzyme
VVRRVSHTAVVVRDVAATANLWSDDFGLGSPTGLRKFADNAVLQVMFPVGESGAFAVLQSTHRGTPMWRAAASGRGLFHVATHVADLDAAVAELRGRELMVQVMPPTTVMGAPYAWVAPASACGAYVGVIRERPTPRPTPGPAGTIRRLAHIGHVVDDLGAAVRLYRDVLGFALADEQPLAWPEEGVETLHASAPEGPAVKLIRVTDPASLLGRLHRRLGEGLTYLGLEVDDLDATIGRLSTRGYWLQVRAESGSLPRRAWIDPDYAGTYLGGTLGAWVLLAERL